MEFQTELTKQETHYFIDLLNNDYEKMRKEKDNMIDADIISPKCRKARWLMVERFNAPGGPEVSSRGCMDVNAEEFSVYNELNYRRRSR